ncbi:MAG: alanine racemase [Rikenellaceae bacterium]|jgi:alanine racemase|nr:alanine racemase [Rikenellaceae bacterium]
MNYTLSDIARITGGKLFGKNRAVDSVLIDSRAAIDTAAPLFVALSGKNRHGREYLGEMHTKGVRAFLVDREIDPAEYPESGFIVINDTLLALQQWAAAHRNSFQGIVVGITGSNGKTIVKEWVAQLAPAGKKIFRSPRSYNSQIGVPLSLLMLSGDEEVAVIEAGISQPGEMKRLAEMIRPDVTLITNIGSAHQENFNSLSEKLDEKLLLGATSTRIIYPAGDTVIEQRISSLYPNTKAIPAITEYDNLMPFVDPVSVSNARLALTLWLSLGASALELTPGLQRLQPVAMRMELLEGFAGAKLINDSYNADINSLSSALDALKAIAGEQQKVLILSDIFQTGMADADLYGEVARLCARAGIDRLIGVGEHISACATLFSGAKRFYPDTRSLIDDFRRSDFADKAILIKGSRSFGFERISRLLEKRVHTTVLEVNLDAMIRNLNHFRNRLAPGTRVMAMVKALAYGSGGFEVAATLQRQRIASLAVAFADEGVELRERGIILPIVVLNADAGSFGAMIDYRLEPEIYSFASLREFTAELDRRGERHYPIHLSFDTGMHRLGFVEEEVDELIALLQASEAVSLRSAFTHFAASDEAEHDPFTRAQLATLLRIGDRLKQAFPGKEILLHAANSAGIDRFAEAHLDMVRLGIGLYGIPASDPGLSPVSRLKSRIVQIKHLPPGETVGYGRHGKIERESVIATVPVGYADGLDRRLGRGAWHFEVNGRLAPTIGNICMDTCMIDITGIPAAEGDEVIVFGGDNNTVEQMAERLGTIPYEILTSVSARVKRLFLKE